jgi:hypothetical protein
MSVNLDSVPCTVDGKQMGVYVTGTKARLDAVEELIERDKKHLLDQLPRGTVVDSRAAWPFVLKDEASLSDSDRHAWLKEKLNKFANVLRPRLRKWYEETQGK